MVEDTNNSDVAESKSDDTTSKEASQLAVRKTKRRSCFSELIHSRLGSVIVGGIIVGIASALTANFVTQRRDLQERNRLRSFTESFFINDISNMNKKMRKDFDLVLKNNAYAENSLDVLNFNLYEVNTQNLKYLECDTIFRLRNGGARTRGKLGTTVGLLKKSLMVNKFVMPDKLVPACIQRGAGIQ